MAGGPPGEEQRLLPGDAILFDATLPQRTLVTDADDVTVTLARDLIEAVVPNARHLQGRILPRKAAGPVGEAVLSLARMAPGLAVGQAKGAGRLIAGLLGEVADSTRAFDHGSADELEVDLSRRLKAELFIDANLERHNLDAPTVARGVGVSRTNLYRAFKTVGGIEREIIRRRATRLRSLILRLSEARSIDVLAHALGFSSSSHCSRVFKEFYGLAPNRLRAELRSVQDSTVNDLKVDRMREWYSDLNAPASALSQA